MFKDQIILITGGTGSWGKELTRQLLSFNPKEIRIFSRNEFLQVSMQQQFEHDPKLRFIIGDVRDYQALQDACKGVNYIFHLAALKHVPICELQPLEALKTNVLGTENIIRASVFHKVKKVIDVSTDKAVDPINFYGMSKSFGEKMILRADELSNSTRFVCIRGGNVLGTNGSVVPLFKEQILRGEPVKITSDKMTRFFLTIAEAIGLLLKAAQASIGGEIFVMMMKACRIIDLAIVLGEKLINTPPRIKKVGIRRGEKLHEVLISTYESPTTYHYNDNYFVILPSHPTQALVETYHHLIRAKFRQYASNTDLMNKDDIAEMLIKGGFIPKEL